MRITYLVYENGQSGGKLKVATKEEWSQIMDENRGLPCDKRRYFIEDTIDDFGEIDRIYIETSKQEYDRWHADNQRNRRKRKSSKGIEIVSMDFESYTDENCSLHGVVTDRINWETLIDESMEMESLTLALAEWQPWAIDILECYLAGQKRECTKFLSLKQGVSVQTIRTRKREFEAFVLGYLHLR